MSHGVNPERSIHYALGANFSIFMAKLLAAFYTGSGALMAEALHSLADTGNQLLLLLGINRAGRPPTPEYPLGYGKAVYFWSFIVALLLFSMGGLFSVYEGIHKLRHPRPLSYPIIAIAVLVFSIVAEGISMWKCMHEVNKIRYGRNLRLWFHETRQSELMVIFGEDLTALLGLSFALLAVFITIMTGNPVFDALGSIMIGILLIIIAILLGREVKDLLIGQSVEPIVRSNMMDFLNRRNEIEKVFSLLTLQLGNDVMVAIKAKPAPVETPAEMIEAINRCETEFKQVFPEVVWLFFEPDLRD